jgi:transposase
MSLLALSGLLELSGVRLIAYTINAEMKTVTFHLSHEFDYAICSECGHVSNSLHQNHSVLIRDLDILEYTCYLQFEKRRFDCDTCGLPFTEQLSFCESYSRYTTRFEQHVFEVAKEHTISRAAEVLKLGYRATEGIYYRQAATYAVRKEAESSSVEVLGIDEIALKKGHKDYVLVISDLTNKRVLAILKNRLKETLVEWLNAMENEMKAHLRVVCLDMWEPYHLAIQEVLPAVDIVVDRFHVMQNLNSALNDTRRTLQRQADEETKSRLKGFRWVLVTNPENLTPEGQAKLKQMYQEVPELAQLHQLREEFRGIFNDLTIKRPEIAQSKLTDWADKICELGLVPLQKFASTLRNWLSPVCNYFSERLTSGFVEGVNTYLKLIKRRGFGYRNLRHFELRAMVECGPKLAFGNYT